MRIRTIKPEFWRNRKLASLGREVHDFAARLITASDDEGFVEADPALLAGDLYPFDADAQRFIKKSLPELERIGFIIVRGGELGIICLPKFREHQRINRPTPSRLKARFEQVVAIAQFSEDSVSPHGALTEDSQQLSEPSSTERKGKEQGKEQGKEGEPGRPAAAPLPEDLQRIWNDDSGGALPRAVEITKARRKHAEARLREHPLPYWRDVVKRIGASDFCRGENQRGWVATFDWLLQPDTAPKVLEGKYDNRQRGPAPPKQRDAPTQYADGFIDISVPG